MHELNIVLQVNKKSAPGSDGVHRSILHHTGPEARQIVLAFINKLYKDRRLPSTWKQAEQVPVPKSDKRNAFRPISLLSCVSKTMESMVLNRALKIARLQFSDWLYGFLPHNGTTDGLVTLASVITENMGTSKSKEWIAVYGEKAFELTHPLVAVHEANKLGIKGNMLAYIVDYLRDNARWNSRVINHKLGTLTSARPRLAVYHHFCLTSSWTGLSAKTRTIYVH